ncbi:major facilitator superfamily protein [Carpediemonas membranifera]|uniref:Major facilitator superfamily protein n=1 Tax=Carpediemonas membranifera TaxID=201153 RepID=A0A8J6BWG4_9EUKA|nr:major facilitator superfamily protein [Carpediemonas membranifera]|eukprot:KAG9392421.1 major facilitator superfamily protein [Carpediemonas membranifera]
MPTVPPNVPLSLPGLKEKRPRQIGRSVVSTLAFSSYDVGNSGYATSIMSTLFPIYYSSYFLPESMDRYDQLTLGLANSLPAIVVSISAPFLGALADNSRSRKPFLAFFCAIGVLGCLALAAVPADWWWLALLCYMVSIVGFSGSNVFYDSLLPSASRYCPSMVDVVSSSGYAFGYVGGGVLLVIQIVMIFASPSSLGSIPMRLAFASTAVWWSAFTLPTLLFVRELPPANSLPIGQALARVPRDVYETVKSFGHYRQLALFLASYWLYIDGVDTTIRLAASMGAELGISDLNLMLALLMVQFCAFPAALGYGVLGKLIGPKPAIMIALVIFTVGSVVAAIFMSNALHFFMLSFVTALVMGGTQALSRSLFARMIPPERETQFFGFFNMLGKFSVFMGPILVGVTSTVLNVRWGLASLSLLFFGGLVLLILVSPKKAMKAARAAPKSVEQAELFNGMVGSDEPSYPVTGADV